jgi:hypothetical protein
MAESIEATVRALRIIVGSLIGGLVALSAIALAVGPIKEPPDPELGRLVFAGLGLLAVACAAAYFVVRQALARDLAARAAELRQHPEPATLILLRYRQFVIVGAGVIDGPGAFAGIAYLLTGNPVAIGVVGGAVVLLLLHMPSVDSLRRLAEGAAAGG